MERGNFVRSWEVGEQKFSVDKYRRYTVEQNGVKTFDSAQILTAENFREVMGIEYNENLVPDNPQANLGANFLDAIYSGNYPTATSYVLKGVVFPARDDTHYIEIPDNFILEDCELHGGFIGLYQGNLTPKQEGVGVLLLLPCTAFEKRLGYESGKEARSGTEMAIPGVNLPPRSYGLALFPGVYLPIPLVDLALTSTAASSSTSTTASSSTSTTATSSMSTTASASTSTSATPAASSLLDFGKKFITELARPLVLKLAQAGIAVPKAVQKYLPDLMTPVVPIEVKFAYRAVTTVGTAARTNETSNNWWSYKHLEEAHPLSIQLFGEAIRSGKLKLDKATSDKLQFLSHPEAAYQRGMMYLEAKVVVQTRTPELQAFKEFSDAANLGHIRACYQLGMMYLEGLHVEKNEEKALYWLGLAADKGDWDARFERGLLCYQSEDEGKRVAGEVYLKETISSVGRESARLTKIFDALKEKNLLSGELAYEIGSAWFPFLTRTYHYSNFKFDDEITSIDMGQVVKCWQDASSLEHGEASFQLARIYQGTFNITISRTNRKTAIGSSEKSDLYKLLSAEQRDKFFVEFMTLAYRHGHSSAAATELSKHYKSKCSMFDKTNENQQKAQEWAKAAELAAGTKTTTNTSSSGSALVLNEGSESE